MNEASRCGFYPGPDAQNSVQQDRLRKCSLAIVEPAQADTQHATRNKEKITKKLSPKSYRQERLVSGVDRGFLTELLGLTIGTRLAILLFASCKMESDIGCKQRK